MPWLSQASIKEQEYWRAFYDPARVAMRMNLIDYTDLELYLYAQARVQEEAQRTASLTEEEDDGGEMMMLMGSGFAINATVQAGNLTVEWLGDSDNYYRVESATSLTTPDWAFVHVVWGEDDFMSWVHALSAGPDLGFYRVEQRALDDPADTSGDGVDDVWKMLHGLDPLSSTDVLEDGTGNGLTWWDEYQLGTAPNNPAEGAARLQGARQQISLYWSFLYSEPLVFTNAPGSAADLQDLRTALMALSGHFNRPEVPE